MLFDKSAVDLMAVGTPWQIHKVDSVEFGEVEVYVKRDDLCAKEATAPNYSKMRGLEMLLRTYPAGTAFGVQDAGVHSRSGWGTAYLCEKLGMKCYDFYPVYKNEGTPEDHQPRDYQLRAQNLGAVLMPYKAGMAKICWNMAKKQLAEIEGDNGIMLPAGLKIKENAMGTAIEAYHYTPEHLRCGTWIFGISSGTTMAGALLGLKDWEEDIRFIAYMGCSKNKDRTRDWMVECAGYSPTNLEFVDEGWKYTDTEDRPMPFPSSPYYEAKAWWWMANHLDELEDPLVFWNIGD